MIRHEFRMPLDKRWLAYGLTLDDYFHGSFLLTRALLHLALEVREISDALTMCRIPRRCPRSACFQAVLVLPFLTPRLI